MKKIYISISIVTFLALAYVHQNVRLLECSYDINSNNKTLSNLIDQNKYLRYNIAQLESPARLEKFVTAHNSKLDVKYAPSVCHTLKPQNIVVPDMKVVPKTYPQPAPAIFSISKAVENVLGLNSEAVAKELDK